jgi:glucose-1-phosphate adenylyltransferase
MGVYVFRKSVLLESLRTMCNSESGTDFGRDVIPALIRSGHTYAYDFRDKTANAPRYWRDIGTIDAYHTASMDVVSADSPLAAYASGPRQTKRPAPRLHDSSRLTRTVLSPGVHVGRSATIEQSVLMPGVRVGAGARLRGVIVEEGVHIPAGFRAGFDAEYDRTQHTVTDSGIVVISQTQRAERPTLVIGYGTGRARNLMGGDADPVRATA